MKNTGTTHQASIPSPIAYVMRVREERQLSKCRYSMETLWKLVLMGICAGSENVRELHQWLEDQAEELYEQGFRTLKGEKCLPSEVTLYRFFWILERCIVELEHQLKIWAIETLNKVIPVGEMLVIHVDGKHLRGSTRKRCGDKGLHMLSLYINQVGMTLMQEQVKTDEAKTARQMIGILNEVFGRPWILTGDAAFTERAVIDAVLEANGRYFLALKDNRSSLKKFAEWAFSLEFCEEDSQIEDEEHRSGEIWLREIETRPVDEITQGQLPEAQYFVRCLRTVVCKTTGEIKSQETQYAITSAHGDAMRFYLWWRGHWAIENRSHHKRDTIWREDFLSFKERSSKLCCFT